MKKIFALLLAVIMCLSFTACGKPYDEDVLECYESTELTAENVTEYFELELADHTDAFGDKTGETALLFKIKDGYIFGTNDVTILRVYYTVATVKYAQGSEKPVITAENLETDGAVVDFSSHEYDYHFSSYDRQLDLAVIDQAQYTEDGFLCETQIVEWGISKASGSVVSYDLTALDAFFPVDKNGLRIVEFRYKMDGKKYDYTETFDANSEDWEHAYWYELVYDAITSLSN